MADGQTSHRGVSRWPIACRPERRLPQRHLRQTCDGGFHRSSTSSVVSRLVAERLLPRDIVRRSLQSITTAPTLRSSSTVSSSTRRVPAPGNVTEPRAVTQLTESLSLLVRRKIDMTRKVAAKRTTTKDVHRAQLRTLSRALRDVHRSLVEFSRERYELDNGRVRGKGQLFELLLRDDAFAWLRPLSRLIVSLDELAARRAVPSEEETATIRTEVEEFISPAAGADSGCVIPRAGDYLAAELRVNLRVFEKLLFAQYGMTQTPAAEKSDRDARRR